MFYSVTFLSSSFFILFWFWSLISFLVCWVRSRESIKSFVFVFLSTFQSKLNTIVKTVNYLYLRAFSFRNTPTALYIPKFILATSTFIPNNLSIKSLQFNQKQLFQVHWQHLLTMLKYLAVKYHPVVKMLSIYGPLL